MSLHFKLKASSKSNLTESAGNRRHAQFLTVLSLLTVIAVLSVIAPAQNVQPTTPAAFAESNNAVVSAFYNFYEYFTSGKSTTSGKSAPQTEDREDRMRSRPPLTRDVVSRLNARRESSSVIGCTHQVGMTINVPTDCPTIQGAIDIANSGDTINVAAGTYTENITVNKQLTILGPNASVNPNTGTRNAEAVIIPATSNPYPDPDVDPNYTTAVTVVTLAADGITFKGFTVDGDNTTLAVTETVNGATPDATYGIFGTGTTVNPNETVSNNIVKNIGEFGINISGDANLQGARTGNSVISNNLVDNVLGKYFGEAIRVSENAVTNVTNNVVTRSYLGITVENFNNLSFSPAATVNGNKLTVSGRGVYHNLHYAYTNNGFTYSGNTISSYIQDPNAVSSPDFLTTRFRGFVLESVNGQVPVTIKGNTISPDRTALSSAGYTAVDGVYITGDLTTSSNITFTRNRISNAKRGIAHVAPAVPNILCNQIFNNLIGIYVGTDTQFGGTTSSSTNGININYNNIFGNSTYGLQNSSSATSTTVNATNDYWGAASGPNSPANSVNGLGDAVDGSASLRPFASAKTTCPQSCLANATSFDVVGGFSLSSNPNCNFQYGYTANPATDSTFTKYPFSEADVPVEGIERFYRDNPDPDLVPAVLHNYSDTTINYFGIEHTPDVLNLHPGQLGERSVVRFTVPTTGRYRVNGRFIGIATSGTTTDTAIIKRSGSTNTPIFNGNVTGFGEPSAQPFDNNVAFNAGDIIDFSVGYGSNGNYGSDSTGLSAIITFVSSDVTPPVVSSINRANGSTNPTNAASVDFTVTFSEPVTGVDLPDFQPALGTGITAGSVSGIIGSGTTYTVTVSGITGSGTVGLNLIDDDSITDSAGNKLGGDGAGNGNFTTEQTYTIDMGMPTVTINQATNQPDPTSASPINFTVVFSKPVTGFGDSATDVDLSQSTAGGTLTATVSQIAPNDGTTYNVAVSGMTSSGTVVAKIPANAAVDGTNNGNSASGSTDNSVTYLQALVTNIDTGLTYPTIQAANDASQTLDGHTIRASAGVYPERVNVTKSLTIQGAQYGVDPRTGRADVNAESTVGISTGAFNVQSPVSVTIAGFRITGANAAGDTPAILLLGNPNNLIVNNIIEGNSRGAYFSTPNTTFKHNRLNNTGDGFFGGVDNTTVEENLFTGGHPDGAVNTTVSSGDTTVNNYRLINNVSQSSGNFGVIFATVGSEISGNTIQNTTGSALFVGGGNSGLTVRNNTFTGTRRQAINVNDAGYGYGNNSNINFNGNTVTRSITDTTNAFSTIDYRGVAGSNEIYGNTVTLARAAGTTTNPTAYGVRVRGSGSGNFDITGNVFNGGGLIANVTTTPATSGVVLSSNQPNPDDPTNPPTPATPATNYGLLPATSVININCNNFNGLQNGIIAYDYVNGTTGGLPTGIHVNANGDNFLGNSLFGINNGGTSETIDATNSYWNSPSGPSGVGSGSGDAVSANVTFTPFLTAASMCAPVNTVPAAQIIPQDTTLTFSGANQISVTDLDVGSNPVTITLSVTNGTLTLSQITGLTFTAGANGSATMTFSGTLANVNAALNGLTFNPTALFVGTSTLTLTSSSMGSPGVGGGTQSDTDTVTISVLDAIAPTVSSISRGTPSGQNTNAATVVFNVTFSEPVTGVDASDFALTGTINYTGATIMVSTPDSGATRTVTVTGYTGDGTLGLNLVDDDSIADAQGNKLGGTGTVGAGDGSAVGETYNIDQTRPTVQITQAAGQLDPTTVSPINFTVAFSETVSGFVAGDVTVSGTAGATTANVQVTPASGTGMTFNVQVTPPMGGTVVINIAQNVAADSFGNGNIAFTPTTGNDNSVTYFTTTSAMVVDDDGMAGLSSNGTPNCAATTAAPNTIQSAINLANPGNTIYVCPGTYIEDVNINKSLTLLGPNAGVSPNNADGSASTTRGAEAIIVPATSSPNDTTNGTIVVNLNAQNITFNGFTIDGDNPTGAATVSYNGATPDATFGIYNPTLGDPKATIINNIVKNPAEAGIYLTGENGAATTNSTISNNRVDNVIGVLLGQAIAVYQNAHANVSGNVVTRSYTGFAADNIYIAPTVEPRVENNFFTVGSTGIYNNNHYSYSGKGYIYSGNKVTSYVQSASDVPSGATTTRFRGIELESIQGQVPVTVTGNTVSPDRAALTANGYTDQIDGIVITNNVTVSPNVKVTGNTVTNAVHGIALYAPAKPDISCNLVRNNQVGVFIGTGPSYDGLTGSSSNGSALVNNNNLFKNTNYGVQNAATGTVVATDARSNFWGAANGPSSDGFSTATGSGDKVSTNVTFNPFLNALSGCAPTVPNLSINDVTVTEGDLGTVTATFTVTLSNQNANEAVTVIYATADGTATTADNDYTTASATLTFAATATPSSTPLTQTISVIVKGDTKVEPNETFTVNLSNATNAAILKTSGTGTITNDDFFGSLQFSNTTYSVTEGTPTASITVTRTGGSAQSVSANCSTVSGGTATPNVDYTVVTNQTITFADGDTTPKTCSIPINNDLISEADETVNLALTLPSGSNSGNNAALGSPNTAVLTIVDNDGGGTITISGNIQKSNAPSPNTNLAGVTVTLSGTNPGATTTDVNGNYSFTRTAGGSYLITPSCPSNSSCVGSNLFDPINRNYNGLVTNVSNANFIGYNSTNIPRNLQVVNSYTDPGSTVVVPITINSQGNESAISFSLSYDITLLSYQSAACGADATPCSLTVNPSTGSVGIIIEPAANLVAGSRQIVNVTFNTVANLASNTPINFSSSPTTRSVSDDDSNELLASYTGGYVVFSQGLEGDVAGRFTGNGAVNSGDLTVLRSFVAQTAQPNPIYNEFQRADCAPYATKGNGALNSSDLIQLRRYTAFLDATQSAGGSSQSARFASPFDSLEKDKDAFAVNTIVRIVNTNTSTTTVTVPIEADLSNNEQGFDISIQFNQAILSNPIMTLGSGAPAGSVLTPNTLQTANGRVGFVIDSGTPFGTGTKQITTITFTVAGNAPIGLTPLTFINQPIALNTSDNSGNSVPTTYMNGNVNIVGPTAAAASISGRVRSAAGKPAGGVTVTLTDSNGMARSVRTSFKGLYRFDEVPTGSTYTIAVSDKFTSGTPQVITLVGDLSALDLIF